MKETFSLSPLVLAISACLMAGCGGGGGGSSAGTDPAPAPTPEPSQDSTTVSMPVQVIDGYFSDIEVCIVKENDPALGCDETFGTVKTNAEGKAVFTGDEEKFKQLAERGHVRFKAVAKKGAADIIRGEQTDLDNDATLLSTRYLTADDIEGLKGEQKAGSEYKITPFTTLVEKHLRNADGTLPEEGSYTETLGTVADLLGLDPSILSTDYNAEGTESADADRALAAGEIIVASNLLPNNAAAYKDSMDDEQKEANLQEQMSAVKENVDKVIEASGSDSGKIADAIMNRKDTLRNSFVSLSTGLADEWRCGTTEANEVWCWGNNTWNNLGNPEFSAKVKAAGKYTPRVADDEVKRDEDLMGNWTAEPVHVLIKNPDYKSESDPEYIPLKGVSKVAAGNIFACALTVDREVWCWGGNYHGQLGLGSDKYTMEYETVPYASKVVSGQQDTASGYLGNVVDLSAGQNNICALTADGDVYCWGDNTAYELGAPFEDDRVHPLETYTNHNGDDITQYLWVVPYPVKVPAPDGTKFTAMTKGGLWTHCAITDPTENEHNLWCWGDDTRGMVSGNNRQYREEIQKNWEDKIHYDTGNGNPEYYSADVSWNWHYRAKNGGDWWPMFGQPVTNVKTYSMPTEVDHVLRYKPIDGKVSIYLRADGVSASELENYSICARFGKTQCTDTFPSKTEDGLALFTLDIPDEEKVFGFWLKNDTNDTIVPYVIADASTEPIEVTWNATDKAYSYGQGNFYDPVYEDKVYADMKRVSSLDITEFDSILIFSSLTDGKATSVKGIYTDTNKYDANLYDVMKELPEDGDQVAKVATGPEAQLSFVLTEQGRIYAFESRDSYAMTGNGHIGNKQTENGKETWVNTWGVEPLVLSDKHYQVKDLSVNKRSVCAFATDSEAEDPTARDLWCWGSSTFGQLGFDNNDNDFAFTDTSYAWDGGSNEYFDAPNRIEKSPKKIDFGF